MGSLWKSPTFVIFAFAISWATGVVGVWGLLPVEHSPRLSQLAFGLLALAFVLSVLALGPALDLLPESWKTSGVVRVRNPYGPTFTSPAWTQSAVDVCTSLSCPSVVGAEHTGLSDEEASRRILEYGQNVVQSMPPPNPFLFFLKELHEPTQMLLLVVGVLYALVGSRSEAVAAFVVIALMVAAEMGTEYRAKLALLHLRTSTPQEAMLLRSGLPKRVDRNLVVPGDCVILRAGMEVPADIRLLEAVALQVDESSITGEAVPVIKNAELILPADSPVTDRENVVLAGTMVTGGRGKGVVYATGRDTAVGANVELARKDKEKKTPLQKMLKEAAGKLTLVAVVASLGGTALGLWKGARWQDAILTGLSLAFATIPEELPILVTAVLAVGAQFLSKKKIYVKRLQGAESLGYVDTLLTDKTGTLTENRLELQGWAADPPLLMGLRDRSSSVAIPMDGDEASEVMEAWVFMAEVGDLGDHPETHKLNPAGEVADPFDRAVLLSWGKGGEALRSLQIAKGKAHVMEDVPFHSATKTSSRTFSREGKVVQYLKGAPELLAGECGGGGVIPWQEAIEAAAATGLRMIGYAVRRGEESEAKFVGVLAFRDPVRQGAAEAVASCQAAGIRVVMVTGDHLRTAQAVARQVGLFRDAGESLSCVGGAVEDVETTAVFARAAPADKYAILQALQEAGHCVAVTGDGVNDAPVLAHADVGLAMGGGSDAARAAAPIVILNDSFGSVVDALTEGRRLVDNLRKALAFYLGAKVGLLLLFAVGTLWDRFPLAPIHIIVLELFMDLGASTSFVVEAADRNVMTRSPRKRTLPFFDTELLLGVVTTAISLSTSVLVCFGYAVWYDTKSAQTCSFYAWLLTHVFVAMNMRSLSEVVLPKGILSNVVMVVWLALAVLLACVLAIWGHLRSLLHITSISWEAWTIIFVVSIVSSWWIEGVKWFVEVGKIHEARGLAISKAMGVDNPDVEKGDLRQPLVAK